LDSKRERKFVATTKFQVWFISHWLSELPHHPVRDFDALRIVVIVEAG
jgi:hypothetical protein